MSKRREWAERALGMRQRIGFGIEEEMAGTHTLVHNLDGDPPHAAGETLPFRFTVRWGHPRLSAFLSPLSGDFLSAKLEGEVDAGGLCHAAPCQGTLDLAYFSKSAIFYTFDFDVPTADGAPRRLRFRGEKRHIRPWNLPWSHTTCYGEIFEVASGETISTALVHFRLNTLIPFLRSFHLT